MYNNDFSHIGKMVRKAVKDITRADGKVVEDLRRELGSIGKEFNNLGEEIKREFAANTRQNAPPPPPPPPPPPYRQPKQAAKGPPHRSWGTNQTPYPPPSSRELAKIPVKTAPMSVIGILMLVFGGIGLGVCSILALCVGLSMAIGEPIISAADGMAALVGILGLLIGGNALMIWKGKHFTKRNKRYKQYQREIKNSDFCPIGMLASTIGQTENFVVKDLKKMIRRGMFPGSHLDSRQTCLILNYETYQQYLRAEEEMQRREKQTAEDQHRKEETNKQETSKPSSGDRELDSVIAEGRSVIRRIREANDRIPGEEISQKISHLEKVTSKIFEYVEQHPTKLPEIHKFMNYYLPTTLKLLNAYEEFDLQPVQGENISQAKLEIQSTLDTINKAFENLLDSLFGDIALDIATDISVLESMLAQEGLMGSDFKIQK